MLGSSPSAGSGDNTDGEAIAVDGRPLYFFISSDHPQSGKIQLVGGLRPPTRNCFKLYSFIWISNLELCRGSVSFISQFECDFGMITSAGLGYM